jgi:hypothetical protein
MWRLERERARGIIPPPHPGGKGGGEAGSALRSLDRFLGKLLYDSWKEMSQNLGGNRADITFSGILPLNDPGLAAFLDKPGVFILLGPTPSLEILAVGRSQAPIAAAVGGKVSHIAARAPYGTAAEGNSTTARFLACVAMEEEYHLIRPFWALLNRRLRSALPGGP